MIDAVLGAEVNNRQEVTYRPRGMEDAAAAEAYTEAARWAREQCNAEHEEADALADMLTCGLGWTETRISYTTDADGAIVIERVDPLEMHWDRAAQRAGLTDLRWVYREWFVDLADAKRAWPRSDFLEGGDTGTDRASGVAHTRPGRAYTDADLGASEAADDRRDQVLIRHYQTYRNEPYYRVAADTQIVDMEEDEFKRVRRQLDAEGIPYAKQHRRVYYRAFFNGDTLLEGGRSPCQDGFTFVPITGKRDRNTGQWYGLVRVMMDPQRWANKWLSQAVYILNANAKGGLLAETGAFVDPRRAVEEWARPNAITLLSEGGLDKVKEKVPSPYPAGFDRLMVFALESLPMVTGINLEALGLANREQAGVLESQRKQAAYGILAPYFDSMRLYRRQQGRILLHYLRKYLSDGRWIRILGESAAPAIQLNRIPDSVSFDIIVDQAPTAPDIKQRTWEALVQLIPAMLKAGMPLPPDLLDYTPLPTAMVAKWKQFLSKQANSPSPEQLQQIQEETQKVAQENQQLKLQLKDKTEELRLKAAETEAELALRERELSAELQLKQAEMTGQLALKQREFEMQTALAQTEAETSAALERDKTDKQLAIAADKVRGDRKLAAYKLDLSPPDMEDDPMLMLDALSKLQAAQDDAQKLAQAQSEVLSRLEQILTRLVQIASAPKTVAMPDGRQMTIAPQMQPQPPQQPPVA